MHKFKTTNIKGKEYVQVNERLLYFRKAPEYAGWGLHSEVLQFSDEACVVKATITNEQGREVAAGLAHETKKGSTINRTSMLENCETSAWGRALGNIGIGIETSIATAEEVAQAIEQEQEQEDEIIELGRKANCTDKQISTYISSVKSGKRTFDQVIKYLQTQIK